MSQKVPIKAAKEIGKTYNQNQVVIISSNHDGSVVCVTTWGKSLNDSEQAAIAGNAYKKALGFPDEKCHDVPRRVKNKNNRNEPKRTE